MRIKENMLPHETQKGYTIEHNNTEMKKSVIMSSA